MSSLAILTRRTAAAASRLTAQQQQQHRTLFTSIVVRSEGAPSGKTANPLGKREKAEEERFIREREAEKMEKLRAELKASQEKAERLQKQVDDHHQKNGTTPSSS